MTRRWFIVAPVWGAQYVHTFLNRTLPAIEQAAARTNSDIQMIVFSDEPPETFLGVKIPMQLRQIPQGINDFDRMSAAHREVMVQVARPYDYVMLLTADLLISAEAFTFCESILVDPRKSIVCCAGMRSELKATGELTGNGQDLMRWAWAYRHPIIMHATWPHGRGNDLSRMFFESGANVVTRQALPHPLALRIDGRALGFRPTIDSNLVCNFEESEVYLVTHGEVGLVELSPSEKDTATSFTTMRDRLVHGNLAQFRMMAPRSWLLHQRVVIQGDDVDCGDAEVVELMLRNAIVSSAPSRPPVGRDFIH